jgi:hypothetical protein
LSEIGFETIDDFIAEYGYDTITLDDLNWFEPKDIEHLASLKADELSYVIDLGEDMYVLFITESISIPSNEAVDKIFMEIYLNSHTSEAFYAALDKWEEEAEAVIKLNEKAIELIDLDELFGY